MKKTLLMTLLCVGVGANAADRKIPSSELTKEFCALNADISGYLMVITKECGYELSEDRQSTFTDVSKRCIAKYSSKSMFNHTMAGIHEAKKNFSESYRNDVCSGVFKAYDGYFE